MIGGLGAFVMVAHGWEDFADTIRRKLIMEISGPVPDPRVMPAQYRPMDCLIGEKTFRWRFNWLRQRPRRGRAAPRAAPRRSGRSAG